MPFLLPPSEGVLPFSTTGTGENGGGAGSDNMDGAGGDACAPVVAFAFGA